MFSAAWEAELAGLPEFETSTLHMVCGLLLPIWKRLPDESTRVYRLQTDFGARVIGRRVFPAWAASITNDDGPPPLSGDKAFYMLPTGDAVVNVPRGSREPED